MQYITKTNLSLGPQFGSQMTQYAGLYSVARQTGAEIVFIDKHMSAFRGVKLFEAFDLSDNIIEEDEIRFSEFVLADTIMDERVFRLDTNTNWNFGGWFHTYHYFHQFEHDIQNVFSFKRSIYDVAKQLIDTIRNDEPYPLVSLHVRRGDYIQVSSLNLSLSYYSAALQSLFDLFDQSYFKLIVFSDDIAWCKQNIQGENVIYSESNSNYVDMCMMSLCDHNIIANSSFSWWGAYLNKSPHKIVICPNEYIGPSDLTHQFLNGNYYPPTWKSITTL